MHSLEVENADAEGGTSERPLPHTGKVDVILRALCQSWKKPLTNKWSDEDTDDGEVDGDETSVLTEHRCSSDTSDSESGVPPTNSSIPLTNRRVDSDNEDAEREDSKSNLQPHGVHSPTVAA